MNAAAVPEPDDRTAYTPQEGAEEAGHRHDVSVVPLPVEVQAQSLALGGHGEGRQRGEPIVLVVVVDDKRLPGWSPCPAAGGHEQKAALIQEGEVGAQAPGFF